ncbi:uncharacterized protein LOC115218597 [Octopus sinensis]|uniref:Uncharacterized protein LOC115218597 n=1 Tax=Octopus sinensis TaxID=2607531 RepID=A0A6P7T0W5_9MOLL|nr:uncharacterized protein LOC115218597 [Octopus sinensis]
MLSYRWWYLLQISLCLIYAESSTNFTAELKDYEFNTTATTNFTEETDGRVTTESSKSSSVNARRSVPSVRILTKIESPRRTYGYWPNRRNKAFITGNIHRQVPHTGGQYPSRVPHTGGQYPGQIPYTGQYPSQVPLARGQYPSRVPNTGRQYPVRVRNNRLQYPRLIPSNRAQFPRQVINTGGWYPIRVPNNRVPYSNYYPEYPTYNQGYERNSQTFNVDQSGKPQFVSDVCPEIDAPILINGLLCPDAIDRFGSHLCYTYEHYYKSCCEKCHQMKNRAEIGCEYGDHSSQCKNLPGYQCYEHYNRAICCEACKNHKKKLNSAIQTPGCEFGDMSPHCKYIKPTTCYQRDIERICCETCPKFKNENNKACPYGDQSSYLCKAVLLDIARCYSHQTQTICCDTCSKVKKTEPGCAYGDHAVVFNSPYGSLNCEQFIRVYTNKECNNPVIKSRCCASCGP